MRAVIYARYSSDNQRDASIEDQIEVCRRYAERQGWTVVEVYADRALSGASRFRSAFQQMQVDAEGRRFDLIVAEALDRLGRKLADVADLHDRLSFLRIGLHTVATGEVTAMHVGMLGTMAQMYLKDLAEKTRRGQLGRALKGRIPGGKAFGYDVLPANADGAGERQINAAEAATRWRRSRRHWLTRWFRPRRPRSSAALSIGSLDHADPTAKTAGSRCGCTAPSRVSWRSARTGEQSTNAPERGFRGVGLAVVRRGTQPP